MAKVDALEELRAKMSKLNVAIGDTVVSETAPPGTKGKVVDIITNSFGIRPTDVQKEVFQYDLSVFMELGTGDKTKIVEFTKKSNRDGIVNNRKTRTVKALKFCIGKYAEFFGNENEIFFDGQSCLFALKDFFNGNTKEKKVFHESLSEITGEDADCQVTIQIQPARNRSFLYSPSRILDMSSADLKEMDRASELIRFTEIILNQEAIMNPDDFKVFEAGKTFLVNPRESGFGVQDTPDVPDGKYIGIGMQKSVRFCEGPQGRDHYGLVLNADAKKAAFHKAQNLVDKVDETIGASRLPNFNRIAGIIKGLRVETTHLRRRKELEIEALSQKTAEELRVELKDGKALTIREYFREKYNIELRKPRYPLILVKERGQLNAYPMEVLNVLPMQRVTIPQQTSEQSGQTTRRCAVAPAQRQQDIWKTATKLKLVPTSPNTPLANEYLKSTGLSLTATPLKVEGRLLPGPKLRYNNGAPGKFNEVASLNGSWRTTADATYLMPATCNVWAIYCIAGGMLRNLGEAEQNLRKFAKTLFDAAKSKGMTFSVPADVAVLSSVEELRDRMKGAKEAKCEFILIATPEKITDVHNQIKLLEIRYEITTQDLKYETMMSVLQGKRMTLENILNKTNIKLGGLNYALNLSPFVDGANWIRSDRLFIGMSVVQPPPGARFEAEKTGGSSGCSAAVLGYASNVLNDPCAIVGDFVYQDVLKEETMVSMSGILTRVLDQYKQNHNGAAPQELWFYRSGIGEGSFKNILSLEIPLLRAHLKSLNLENIKIVFIVVTKEHNIRLFKPNINPGDKPTAQNIPSGVVVDTALTHPNFKEFFLNSHTTLQGTARTPRYNVLVDDVKVPMDELEGVTYALTFNHQIVSLATSLPSPLYIANRYAERGQKVLQAFVEKHGTLPTLNDYSDKLSYSGTNFAGRRVNA